MPHPSAPAAPAPPVSDSAATQQLISQIVSEARSSGNSLVFDPEAPPEVDTDASGAARPARAAKPKAAPADRSATGADGQGPTEENETDEDQTGQEPQDQDAEADAEADQEQEPAANGEINLDAVRLALDAEGGVDMLALAQALGKEPEQIGLTPGAAKFLRLEKKKADATLARANAMAVRLERDYGDQVKARKAAADGQLEPAIAFIENSFGMPWNELNKAVGLLLQGKPVPELEKNRELYVLRKKEADRASEAKKTADAAQAQTKIDNAKTWIRQQIKGDKLASPDFEKQLKDAGFPPVVELVFEEMQANYSKGLTDPKKALEIIRGRFLKQAKALRSVGLSPKAPAPKSAPMSASRPRANAATGLAGNGRQMTDAELRQAVLKEAGLFR